MMPEVIAGAGRVLFVCDHAANHVPADIDLGIEPAVLDRHVAVDIGAGPLTRRLARRFVAPAVLGTVSRLVIDLHREPDHPGLIPVESDGHIIPGNRDVDRVARIARFYRPYHRTIADMVRATRPALIVAVHSFTPRLESGNAADRRWQAGVLYNRGARAAAVAIAAFERRGIVTGDNEPYSGRHLNLTLNRHAEAQGIPAFSVEVRNDLLRDANGVAKWAALVGDVVEDVRNSLASQGPLAT